jgi:hypothetical protein
MRSFPVPETHETTWTIYFIFKRMTARLRIGLESRKTGIIKTAKKGGF